MTTTIIKKLADAVNVKEWDDETGRVTALVNTMGVVDADDDRILSGAFDNSLSKLESTGVAVLWGHEAQNVVGKVLDGYEIGLADDRSVLYLDMLFNMNTTRGRDAYEDVKFGSVTQWSVGFNVPAGALETVREGNKAITNIQEVELVEVSAVLRGSSPGTGTLSVKAEKEKGAISPHDTETTAWDTPWDGPASVAALPADDAEAYREMYAWVNSDADPETKSAYKFPHHEWARAEDVGAANVRACTSGISILNGGMGGADIPEGDRAGVYRHLADHIRDADREPPELKEKAVVGTNEYSTIEEARARAQSLGCDGAHQMEGEGGKVYYMPCRNHAIYESVVSGTPSGNIYSADLDTTKDHAEEIEAVATRIKQVASANVARVMLKWLNSKTKK